MNEVKSILEKVLGDVSPRPEEKENALRVFNEIAAYISARFGKEAKLMGSVAKDTFLKDDKDLDIFVFFGPEVDRKTLEKEGLEIGRAVFEHFKGKNMVVAYAEHPYTRGIISGYEVEIVPAYKITDASKIKSAVDRTPFHTEYVLKRLTAKDDVRLLKAFLKSIGAYGSDLKTSGFSGYLCELLIIRYGSFLNLINAAQSWRYQEIIDIEHLWDQKSYPNLRKKFKKQPLIVIDPVDKNRNVAAALSLEKLARFIFAARRFLETPSVKYFEERKTYIDRTKVLKRVKQQRRSVWAIVFEKPEVIDDILYPQLRKFRDNMLVFLKRNEFIVEDSWIFGDEECGVAFEILVDELPDYRVMLGPRVFDDVKHQTRFLEKHDVVWFKNGRMVAEETRKYRSVRDLFKYHLSGSIGEMRNKGVPRNIAESIFRGYKILHNQQLKTIKSREFWEGLVKFNIKEIGGA